MPRTRAPPHRPKPGYGAYRLGATPSDTGTTFRVFSKHATRIDLLLFDRADAAQPVRTVAASSQRNHLR